MASMKQKIKLFLVDCYADFCRMVFGMKNRVLFVSFSGKSYSDNPRALSEKLHELAPEIEIAWLFQKPKEKSAVVPNYVKCVDIEDKWVVAPENQSFSKEEIANLVDFQEKFFHIEILM